MAQEAVPLYAANYPTIKILDPYISLIQQRDLGLDTSAMSQAPSPQGMSPLLLGPTNTMTTCPHCRASIKTSIKLQKTSRTYIATALWCLVCGCIGCCVAGCSDNTKNTDHYCPNCQKYLGTYEK